MQFIVKSLEQTNKGVKQMNDLLFGGFDALIIMFFYILQKLLTQ